MVPWTGTSQSRRIDSLQSAGGRLALLMEGKVYVYSLSGLTQPSAHPADALLLIGSRMGQSAVSFFHLAPSFLLTSGGRGSDGHFVFFDYWSAEWTQTSEFFT